MHDVPPASSARTDHDEEAAALRLALARGLGPATAAALRCAFGSARAAATASPGRLAATLGLEASQACRLAGAIAAADPWLELRRMRRGGARLLHPGHPAWPPLLRLIDPPPPALWCRGESPGGDRTVAIVGSRQGRGRTLERTAAMAAALAGAGWTIVSGGALGVDAAAHRGALRAGGRTVVVLGGGLDRPSPPSHAGLFAEVLAAGGTLLSEWPMTTEPRPAHFPRRNRVIAGLARIVVVVAAGERSGAHVTARLAVEELGRDVGAVPGDPDDPLARGCLRLIREGAAVIRDVDDVLEMLAGTEGLAAAARAAAEQTVAAANDGAQPSSASPLASSMAIRSCRSRAAAEEPW